MTTIAEGSGFVATFQEPITALCINRDAALKEYGRFSTDCRRPEVMKRRCLVCAESSVVKKTVYGASASWIQRGGVDGSRVCCLPW